MNNFNFGDIVVVEDNLVGVVVKSWGPSMTKSYDERLNPYKYEVYVRSYNSITEYPEYAIKKFIYDKELSQEDLEYYE